MLARSSSRAPLSDEIGDLEPLAATSSLETSGSCKMELDSLDEDVTELEVKALDRRSVLLG